jgi:hypothetical protein
VIIFHGRFAAAWSPEGLEIWLIEQRNVILALASVQYRRNDGTTGVAMADLRVVLLLL